MCAAAGRDRPATHPGHRHSGVRSNRPAPGPVGRPVGRGDRRSRAEAAGAWRRRLRAGGPGPPAGHPRHVDRLIVPRHLARLGWSRAGAQRARGGDVDRRRDPGVGGAAGAAGRLRPDRAQTGVAGRQLVVAAARGGGRDRAGRCGDSRSASRAGRSVLALAGGAHRRRGDGRADLRAARRRRRTALHDRRGHTGRGAGGNLRAQHLAGAPRRPVVHPGRIPAGGRRDAGAAPARLPRLVRLDSRRDSGGVHRGVLVLHRVHRRVGRDDPGARRPAAAGPAAGGLWRSLLAGPADGVGLARSAAAAGAAAHPLRRGRATAGGGSVRGRGAARLDADGAGGRLERAPGPGVGYGARAVQAGGRSARRVGRQVGAAAAGGRTRGAVRRRGDHHRSGGARGLRSAGDRRSAPMGSSAAARICCASSPNA